MINHHVSTVFATAEEFETWIRNTMATLEGISKGTIAIPKAVSDKDGNNIHTTYATKASLTAANTEIENIKNMYATKASLTAANTEIENMANSIVAVKGISGKYTLDVDGINGYEVMFAELGENDAIFFTPETRDDKYLVEASDMCIYTEGNKVIFDVGANISGSINFVYFICRGKPA